MTGSDNTQWHAFGDVTLQNGAVLPQTQLTYRTHGTLNAERSNAVLFPTWFAGQHPAVVWLIGPGRALDPAKWFVIVVNLLGNGASTSPSNAAPAASAARFPAVSVLDNVLLQERLLREVLGIERLALAVGRSMGAQAVYQWASYFPDRVSALLPFVGSARTSPHNYIFLENVRAAIISDPAWQDGDYRAQPLQGLRRLQLVFDAWGSSQAYFRRGLHLSAEYPTTAAYLQRSRPSSGIDANDLLAQVATWQQADISANGRFDGDYAAALAAITARTIVMPSRTDLYFPPADSEIEVSLMPNAELRVIESDWGHRAGAPGTDPADIAFIDAAIRELLEA